MTDELQEENVVPKIPQCSFCIRAGESHPKHVAGVLKVVLRRHRNGGAPGIRGKAR